MKIDFKSFINKNNKLKTGVGKNLIINKNEINTHFSGWLNEPLLPSIERNFSRISFGFNNSIIVLENGSIISNSPKNKGKVYSYSEVLKFEIKKKGFLSKGNILDKNQKVVGTCFGNDYSVGIPLFEEFISYLKDYSPKTFLTESKPSSTELEIPSKNETELNQNQNKLNSVKEINHAKNERVEQEFLDETIIKTLNPILYDIRENIDSNFLSENGKLQIISSTNFMNILKENQNKIIEIDSDYIQNFVKIGSHLKSTQKNIFNIFQRILNDEFTSSYLDLSEFISDGVIKEKLECIKYISELSGWYLSKSKDFFDSNLDLIVSDGGIKVDFNCKIKDYTPILIDLNHHIKSYQNLVLSSFTMIKSLNENDMITFYEMYEVFDKLGIFDTHWEKSVLEKISDVSSSLQDVKESLIKVNSTIKNGLDNLSSDILDMSIDVSSSLDTISLDIQNINSK